MTNRVPFSELQSATCTHPYRSRDRGFHSAIATITDPAGVSIEINSGLENR